jgi:hypothetical protein
MRSEKRTKFFCKGRILCMECGDKGGTRFTRQRDRFGEEFLESIRAHAQSAFLVSRN